MMNEHGGMIMDKMRLGAFAIVFSVLAIVFLLMFMVEGTETVIWASMPALVFSIISAVAAVLMLISYMLSGKK
ncbi:hypothetical protein PTR77_25335 [Serratia bockelmannii]|uniref:hypothetical protein n=1 Tax=Serratia bockelmannii TaxID=2703793 RepID=UPI00313E5300